MTSIVTFNEAVAHWDALIARVEAGEAVLISRDGAPVARLIP
jgi:prevent-host-death family protein